MKYYSVKAKQKSHDKNFILVYSILRMQLKWQWGDIYTKNEETLINLKNKLKPEQARIISSYYTYLHYID
jgi:hypothetical protein